MRSVLRLSLAFAAVVAACATHRSGLDSESHFACKSDADCVDHGPHVACVADVCVVPEGGTTDATLVTGGAGSETGGARNTAGQGGGGGSGGRFDEGFGGIHMDQPDATPTGLPRPLPDAGLCHQCTTSLTPEQSLECYCGRYGCDRTLAEALSNPQLNRVDRGCGRLVVWSYTGIFAGILESFDPMTGRLDGAARWHDSGDASCWMPIESGAPGAAGGRDTDIPLETTCNSTVTCALRDDFDAGPESKPPCDVDALRPNLGSTCGNGLIDLGELCDGIAVQGASCTIVTMGLYPHGILACSLTCDGFDLSGCTK